MLDATAAIMAAAAVVAVVGLRRGVQEEPVTADAVGEPAISPGGHPPRRRCSSSSTVRSAVGLTSSRSSGMGFPLSTDRP